MGKLIFICILLFGISSNIFADGEGSGSTGSSCIESRCMNDRIDELIKVNTELQKENKELQNKTITFDSGFDNYVKVITESKEQANEKGKAYDVALNQIKYWAWFISIILSIVGIGFGIWKGKEIETARKTFETEIKDYREYITKIDELTIKSIVTNKFYENKSIIIDDLKTYLNTEFKDLIESENLAQIKNLLLEERNLLDIKLKDYKITENKISSKNNFDELDPFEGMSM